MTQKRQILHVTPCMSRRYGGPAFAVSGHAILAQEAGYDVQIVTTDLASPPSWQRRAALNNDDLPPRAETLAIQVTPTRFPRRLAYSPGLRPALISHLRQTDLLRVHSLWLYPQYISSRLARASGVPYVVSLHGALDPYLRRYGRTRKWITHCTWQRAMLEGATAIHVATTAEADLTADVAPNVPRIVIPNGVWCDEFARLPDSAKCKSLILGAANAECVLISFIGRLARKKAIPRLLEAYARLPRLERRSARVLIAGPDDEGQKAILQRQCSDLDIADRVTFLDMLDPNERRVVLAATDIWVLPSHTENFGIAVLEALAAGRAVIVSTGVMLAADIASSEAGLVVENRSDELRDAILFLLRSQTTRQTLSSNAVKMAQEYDWSSLAPLLVGAYASMIPVTGTTEDIHSAVR